MDRLTERNENGRIVLNNPKVITDFDNVYIPCDVWEKFINKLADYKDAEEQGRIIILSGLLNESRREYIGSIIKSQAEYAQAELEKMRGNDD